MAGTYAEMAQLAGLGDFVALCKVALLKRAHELYNGETKLTAEELNTYVAILQGVDAYAQRMAWIVASTNATIGAAAPVVPEQADVQYAVNQTLPLLVR